MKTKIILFFLFPCFVFSKQFPLIGQTWVFINGGNKNIVKSVFDFDPDKVLVTTFINKDSVKFAIANLSDKYLRSTGEAVQEAMKQINDTRLDPLKGAYYKASYREVPDFSYSCSDTLLSLAPFYNKAFINGKKIERQGLAKGIWLGAKPSCYAEKEFRYKDGTELVFKSCVEGWCSMEQIFKENALKDPASSKALILATKDVCNFSTYTCRHYIEKFKKKGSNSFFWNLHLYPKIVWNPKHHQSARIMEEIEMTQDEAEYMRDVGLGRVRWPLKHEIERMRTDKDWLKKETAKKYDPSDRKVFYSEGILKIMRNREVDYTDRENLKDFINPVLNKTKSVIFSAQFKIPENGDLSELNFNLLADSEEKTSYYHYPERAYQVMSLYSEYDIKDALLNSFAKDKEQLKWLDRFPARCGYAWISEDIRIGKKAYVIRDDLEVVFRDRPTKRVDNQGWYEYKETKVKNQNGDWEIESRRQMKTKLLGQKAVVRDIEFPYSDYWWKGCPDDIVNSSFPYTKTQMQRVLMIEVPLCNIKMLPYYGATYKKMIEYLSGTREVQKMAERRLYEARYWYKKLKNKTQKKVMCPDRGIDVMAKKLWIINPEL